MRNNFIVKLRYKGSEEYKIKDKDEVIVLHEFIDSVGNSFKIASDFEGEKDQHYFLSIYLSDSRKDGTYKKYWQITPIDPNDVVITK